MASPGMDASPGGLEWSKSKQRGTHKHLLHSRSHESINLRNLYQIEYPHLMFDIDSYVDNQQGPKSAMRWRINISTTDSSHGKSIPCKELRYAMHACYVVLRGPRITLAIGNRHQSLIMTFEIEP